MAMSDIQKLRQQALFNIAPQMDMGGGMDMGGSGYEQEPMSYSARGPMGGAYRPPPIDDQTQSRSPLDQIGQPSTGPTFPSGTGTMDPRTVQAPGGGSPTTNAPGQQSLQEYIDMINKGYTPDFTDRDRLRKLMDSVPERKAPSFARSLVAAGLSVKAEDPVKTAEQVMQAPYLRDMASWKEKTEPYYKTADLENRQNVNERTLMTNAITAKSATDRLMEQGRQADQKAEIARTRAENDAIRARAYAAKNNGYTVMKAGDRIVGVDPATNRRIDLGPSGGLDRETELDILGEWNVKAAEARGTAAVQTAQAGAVAGNRDLVVIDGQTYQRNPDRSLTPVEGAPKGTPNRIGTPSTRTGATGAKTNTLETRRQIQDTLQTLYQTDEIAKKWIKRQTGGGYGFKDRPVVSEASGIWPFNSDAVTQDDVDEYDQIRKEVDPSYNPPAKGLGPRTPPGGAGGRGGGAGNPPAAGGGGRGGGGANPPQEKTITRRQYSPSRNQTRITYSDGTTATVAGKQ